MHPERHPGRRAAIALAASTVLLATAVGCSSDRPVAPDSQPASPATASTAPVSSTTAPSAQPSEVVPTPDGTDPIPPAVQEGPTVPALTVPGIDYEQVSTESTALSYSMRWPVLPGATALNERLRAETKAQLRSYLADNSGGLDTGSEMHLGGEVVLYADGVVGVRLTTSVPRGARGAVMHVTLYGDIAGTWSARSVDLILPARQREIASTVRRKALAATPGATATGGGTPAGILSDLTPVAGGGLLAVIDQGLIASLDAGTLSTRIPAAQLGGALSERGRAVLAAAAARPPAAAGTSAGNPTSGPTHDPTGAASPSSAPSASAVDCSTARCVALTFDDGPGRYTDKLLGALQAAGAPATFFVLGQNVHAYPEVVRRLAGAGMVVGNHTWDHRSMTSLDATKQRAEVESTQRELRRVLGPQPVALLRPPYGALDDDTRRLGLPLILWDVDTEDWKNLNTAETTRRALEGARPGSIILMHDIHPTTVAAVPRIIEGLRARGFSLVTVPQLLGRTVPGKTYFRR